MISQLTPYLARAVTDDGLQTAQEQRSRPAHTYSVPVVREIPRPTERDELARTW